MASVAALEGISVFGLAWRSTLNLRGQPARLGNEDALKVGDAAAIRDSIVVDIRNWLKMPATRRALSLDERLAIEPTVDELADAEDDIDSVKEVLGLLYDQFDYLRVCVVS